MAHQRSTNRPGPAKPAGPRNYLSRREQVRLMLMVGGLMLIVVLMNEARKPKYWTMFTPSADSSAGEPAEPTGQGEIDTHFRSTGNEQPLRLPGEISAETFKWRPAGDIDDDALARRRAEKEFWRQQMELLPRDERSNLPRVLKAFRAGEALGEDEAQRWEKTLATLDERWREYSQQAMDAVTSDTGLRDEDRGAWLLILHQMQQRWNDSLHDTLAAAADPAALTEAQREELSQFQTLFDELAMEIVRDDTPVSRGIEKNAWYRLFEVLQSSDEQALARADAPDVSFRQLFEQPDEYRGRLVKIHGDVRQAYRVQAPQNVLGIEQFYVFTIFPARGPSSPMIVYGLGVPEGFPPIKDKNIDKDVTLLKEPVEFTGYFFKRMAYPAEKGTMVAPLILARSPQWRPKPVEAEVELPSMWAMLAAVLGAALLGAAVATIVYFRHRQTPSQRYGPAARATPQHLAALRDAPLAPSPDETMASMARQSESRGDEAASG